MPTNITTTDVLNDPRISNEDLELVEALVSVGKKEFERSEDHDSIFRHIHIEDKINQLNLAIRSILSHRVSRRDEIAL